MQRQMVTHLMSFDAAAPPGTTSPSPSPPLSHPIPLAHAESMSHSQSHSSSLTPAPSLPPLPPPPSTPPSQLHAALTFLYTLSSHMPPYQPPPRTTIERLPYLELPFQALPDLQSNPVKQKSHILAHITSSQAAVEAAGGGFPWGECGMGGHTPFPNPYPVPMPRMEDIFPEILPLFAPLCHCPACRSQPSTAHSLPTSWGALDGEMGRRLSPTVGGGGGGGEGYASPLGAAAAAAAAAAGEVCSGGEDGRVSRAKKSRLGSEGSSIILEKMEGEAGKASPATFS